MSPSELKAKVEATGSLFFTKQAMLFFGDTMGNYRVVGPVERETDMGLRPVYVLLRKRAVKNGLRSAAHFDADTFERRFIAPHAPYYTEETDDQMAVK